MYHPKGQGKGSSKKGGFGESLFVAENTKAWAKLPKDFSPTTLGGMSVNPAPPDFQNMAKEGGDKMHAAVEAAMKKFNI